MERKKVHNYAQTSFTLTVFFGCVFLDNNKSPNNSKTVQQHQHGSIQLVTVV